VIINFVRSLKLEKFQKYAVYLTKGFSVFAVPAFERYTVNIWTPCAITVDVDSIKNCNKTTSQSAYTETSFSSNDLTHAGKHRR
jgi:hypothetical protein